VAQSRQLDKLEHSWAAQNLVLEPSFKHPEPLQAGVMVEREQVLLDSHHAQFCEMQSLHEDEVVQSALS